LLPITPSITRLPIQSDDKILLSPYMASEVQGTNNLLVEWIANIWKPADRMQTYTLLHQICTHIHESMSYRVREEPGVQTAEQTLSSATGSCRDFAALFMVAARCLGFAARFVSGYLHAPPSTDNLGATHAWAEVYLPGAGWKGFDPTIGEIAGADHFAVAVARI
jgi:transglutaminase-like putative cysteine protease